MEYRWITGAAWPASTNAFRIAFAHPPPVVRYAEPN